jgi:flagellin-specific chaperone FliS
VQTLTQNPAAAYRRVDMDARVEASASADLTRILLEEAIAALGQALIVLERASDTTPSEALTRANGIALYLARSVGPDNPMREALVQFYGGLAEVIGRNMREPRHDEIAQARADFRDVLGVFG